MTEEGKVAAVPVSKDAEEMDLGSEQMEIAPPVPTYNLLRGALLSDVIRWLEEDRARRRTASLTMASIATVALVAIAGVLVNELLVFNVERSVNQAIADNLSSVNFQSRLGALNFRAVALDQADGFSDEEADGIVQSIEALYESGIGDGGTDVSSDVRSRNIADLMFAVDTAVESFAAADRSDLVSQIRSVAPAVSESSSVMTQVLVQMTGRELIGMAGGAEAWTDRVGVEEDTYREYRQHAARANRTGFRGHFLVFELIVRHMEGRPERELRELADQIVDLDEPQQEAFVGLMTSLVQGTFINEPTAAAERVMARAGEFLDAYGDASPVLGGIVRTGGGGGWTAAPTVADIEGSVPVAIGDVERYTFEPGGDVGWYRVPIERAGTYEIEVTSVNNDPMAVIGSFGEEFEQLAMDDDGGVGTNVRMELELEPGVYYLGVRDFNEEEGTFRLRVAPTSVR